MNITGVQSEAPGFTVAAQQASEAVDVARASVGSDPETVATDLIQAALQVLLQAHDYASSMRRDVWDFAIELPHLLSIGLSISDIRCLAYQGLIQPAEEVDSSCEASRKFRDHGHFRLLPASCFVLTSAGVVNARQLAHDTPSQSEIYRGQNGLSVATVQSGAAHQAVNRCSEKAELHEAANDLGNRPIPKWDGQRRQLRVAGKVVKSFKLPSPNQETILSAFEEEGWPIRIDDPLPPVSQMNPKRRLLDTIKSLNRRQKARSLRFMGDGSGKGVVWELVAIARP